MPSSLSYGMQSLSSADSIICSGRAMMSVEDVLGSFATGASVCGSVVAGSRWLLLLGNVYVEMVLWRVFTVLLRAFVTAGCLSVGLSGFTFGCVVVACV